jgi:hypothetical protein
MKGMFSTWILGALLFAQTLSTQAQNPENNKYKCMIQMTNYMGEGAYIVVSLIDPAGNYEKTLRVLGSDKRWYPDLAEWHKFSKKTTENISAITGASVAGGDRSVTVIEIDQARINTGYRLRFESAVENQEYHSKDVEIVLTTESVSGKTDGAGYIRYVRLSPNL